MTRGRVLLIVGGAVPAVSVLIGLVTGPASGQSHWPGWFNLLRSHPWPSLAVLTAASIGLAALATMQPKGEPDLPEVADQLAAAVERDWDYEAKWRKVFDPYPLPVKWIPADPGLVVSWDSLVRLAASRPGGAAVDSALWATGPTALAGEDNDLADVLGSVPTSRLIVLGDKGTGKTVLLMRLVLDLLQRRERGGPVPILLPLASWNPAEQDLQTWMVEWLKTDRAGLAGLARAGKRISLATALVEKGKILPVLDGLDEIPERARGEAIIQINEWLRPEQGLVLAARTNDYKAAAHPSGTAPVLLAGAAGIELQPLDIAIVAGYLKDSASEAGTPGRWEPVIASLTSSNPPAAARALTTPLMAAFARVAYNPRPGEDPAAVAAHPAELLDTRMFPDAKEIEDHLFEQFIPASYRRHPDSKHLSRRYKWTAEQAQRWLAFLAQSLQYQQDGATDIAWWRLPNAAPKRVAGVVLGMIAGLAFAFGYPFQGYGIGLIAGILVGAAARRWLPGTKQQLGLGMAGGVIGGLLGGLVGLPFLDFQTKYLLVKLLTGGIAVGIPMSVMNAFIPSLLAGLAGETVIAFYENHPSFDSARAIVGNEYHFINAISAWLIALLFVEVVGRDVPARQIRWSPTWFGVGLICSLVTGAVIWAEVGPHAGLAVGIAGALGSGLVARVAESTSTDLKGAADPGTVLKRDRTAFLAAWLGLGLALGFAAGLAQALTLTPGGHTQGWVYGAQIGATTFVAVGLVFGVIQAMWASYAVSRCYFAATARLPWRFMPFLRDAHASRGVLRQVGAIYQFRHVELQRRLARSAATAANGMAYCPFDIDPDLDNLNLGTVRIPTRIGAIVARVSKDHISDTGTMYIHGAGADWATWTPLIRAAAELELPSNDQIFVDVPGFGESENKLYEFDIAEVGAALLEVADALGHKTVKLVGHSMGGFLALDMASRYKERIESIHLIAGPYFSILEVIQHPLKSFPRDPVLATIFGLQYLIARTGTIGLAARKISHKLGLFRPLLAAFTRYPYRLKRTVVKTLSCRQSPQGMILTAANGTGYEAARRWGTIECPIFAVFGDKDRLVPSRDMRRLMQVQPTASCQAIVRSGHLLHIEWPFDVVKALKL